jgi:membrane protein DedA with SNARE-associated domain
LGGIVEAISDWLIAYISSESHLGGLAIISAAAAIEYLVPPFPGDTITLLAAVLITAYGWSFAAVFTAIMVGSVAGSMAAFWLGTRLRRGRTSDDEQGTIDKLMARFERHGPAYLIVNRFVPGIRALFFIAAGMAAMKPAKVGIYSAISAALWHLGILAAGMMLGANLDTLQLWVRRYTLAFAIGLGVVALVMAVRWWLRRQRR